MLDHDNHKPAMSVAFLLDPITFRVSDAGEIELSLEVLFTVEEDEATAGKELLAGNGNDAVSTE
jgi:hypothetical protein